MSMAEGIDCDRVEQESLDLRYIRGTLPEPLAEAFEAHYFGCDHCWGLVRGGNDVRAAGALPRASKRPRAWVIPLAAALVAAVGLGVWRASRAPVAAVPSASLERGAIRAPIALSAVTVDHRLTAQWSKVPGATSYRIRFFAADGAVLLQRLTVDTALVIAEDSLRVTSGAGPTLWQVLALDRLGGEVARSKLVEVR